MGYLNSIREEYDNQGNYIGNSDSGNAFHNVHKANTTEYLICVRCNSPARREHPCGGTVCASCACAEAQWRCR